MAILNPIFLQHGIYLNTSEPVKLQGILHVHTRYTGTVYELDAHWKSPFHDVSWFFKNYCLFAFVFGVGIVPCLSNLLHFIIWWPQRSATPRNYPF